MNRPTIVILSRSYSITLQRVRVIFSVCLNVNSDDEEVTSNGKSLSLLWFRNESTFLILYYLLTYTVTHLLAYLLTYTINDDSVGLRGRKENIYKGFRLVVRKFSSGRR